MMRHSRVHGLRVRMESEFSQSKESGGRSRLPVTAMRCDGLTPKGLDVWGCAAGPGIRKTTAWARGLQHEDSSIHCVC
jgi:hypothetical protein